MLSASGGVQKNNLGKRERELLGQRLEGPCLRDGKSVEDLLGILHNIDAVNTTGRGRDGKKK